MIVHYIVHVTEKLINYSQRQLYLQVPNVKKSDLNLLQLIKAGKEGVFYKAKMTRGTCKGHSAITCKISKEGTV